MSRNIENEKKFVTECQNYKEEENDATVEESAEEFWERMAAEPEPDFLRLWDEIEGYSKFTSICEMENQEPFFVLLIRNEKLRDNKSIRELKKMAEKYAKECSDAENAAKEKTSRRVFEAIRQRWPDSIGGSFERSMGMNEEEIKDFMNFVRESEWIQYIDQTAEEIEQMLMEDCSASVDSIIGMTIEDYERSLSS